MARFLLVSTPTELVIELTKDPLSYRTLMDMLLDRRYDGQVLVDFRRGRPHSVAFPQLTRVALTAADQSTT